jgi:hypothetical protein
MVMPICSLTHLPDQRSRASAPSRADIARAAFPTGLESLAEQTKDDASMAALGQYQSNGEGYKYDKKDRRYWSAEARQDRKLMKINTQNAKRLGVNPDGTPDGSKKFEFGSWEEQQQQSARTAVLQQEAKQAKQIDERFESMLSPNDVMNDVYDSSSGPLKLTGNASTDSLRMERAIASLAKSSKFDKATKLTKAYTDSNLYRGLDSNGAVTADTAATTKHNQQRLGSVLTGSDVKKGAANLYAYGWQTNTALADGNEEAFSYGQMDSAGAGGIDYKDVNGAVLTGTKAGRARSIEAVVQDKIDAATVAGQDKDADWSKFSGEQMAGAITTGNNSYPVTAKTCQ